jgi:hypothetical protein
MDSTMVNGNSKWTASYTPTKTGKKLPAKENSSLSSQKSLLSSMIPQSSPSNNSSHSVRYTDADIPQLCKAWFEHKKAMFQEPPEKLPPMREVSHQIPLKDPNKQYNYYSPRCPEAFRDQLQEKINKYVHAGWWVPCSVSQAAPMLCIPKKNGTLRTAMDLRQRNDNTYLDVTPLPDQDTIRHDVARAKYRSKIDLTNAFEQLRILPEHVD